MKQLLITLVSLITIPMAGASQNNDSTQASTLSNPRPVTVVTNDGKTYAGKVFDITTDYIVMDIKNKQNLLVYMPYYIRPVGNHYKIDVQYLATAYTKKPKRVLKSALYTGLAGMTAFGTSSYISQRNNDGSNNLGDFLAASAAGLAVGSIVGTVTALVVHKKWHINGNSEKLAGFRDYYF